MTHAQAHAWLNRLRRAYRYAHTPARRAQLDRAVRITTARIFADHVAAAKRRQAARKASRMSSVVRFALAQVGKPYIYGASGPRGFDCSGLTAAAMRRIGVRLPHSSHAQGRRGSRVAKSQRRPGDLLHWASGHVGIYVGGGKMVDAPGRGRAVSYRSIWGSPQYRRL